MLRRAAPLWFTLHVAVIRRKRWINAGAAGILLVLCFSSIGFYLYARDSDSEREIRRLIAGSYDSQRPGGGRLSHAAYSSPLQQPELNPDLGRAQLLVLRYPDARIRKQLQADTYLAAGEWASFIDLARTLTADTPKDAATINNIGASYLALADKDPSLLLKALDCFDEARQKAPTAPEPVFNLVITYRKLRLTRLADEYLLKYSSLDAHSQWREELANKRDADQAAIVEQAQHALQEGNPQQAKMLFNRNPALFRRTAMQYVLSGRVESRAFLEFVATEVEQRYGDKTIAAAVAPLFSGHADDVISLRRLVTHGAEFYAAGNHAQSLSIYAEAASKAARLDSSFDRLWVDLNQVDSDIRNGSFDIARETLAHLVRTASDEHLLWMKAKGLAVYGSTLRLTSTYTEMLSLLSQADEELLRLDAPTDRIRVLYYLAAYRYFAGDQDEALRLALECLRLVEDGDSVRLSTVNWLIGSILYRRGLPERSFPFATESVEQSQTGSYANGIKLLAPITLATLYEGTSQYALADKYLDLAEITIQDLPPGFDRIRFELMLNTGRARSKLKRQQYPEAEMLLQKNLNLYARQPFSAATPLLSPSLMLLAQVYSETGRISEAARKYAEAIDVVEKDDEYLTSEVFRIKFDDERRELYDSAIDFELRNRSVDAAWTYLQKYRAKLFLEFLAAFNPTMQQQRTKLSRSAVQARIPNDTQVVEYALLKDRLLIWVVTDKLFVVRSVPASRSEVEGKVQEVLQRLRSEQDADALLEDLGNTLIGPVETLLDPNRTLAIIPDRALHGLPFDALLKPASRRYLIEEFPIVVSPSLTHLLATTGSLPSRETIVAFGSQNGGSAESREIGALAEIYPKANTFGGVQVDKSTFLNALQTAAVFHYAGHSATDAVDPLRSSILLDGKRFGPNSVTAVDISQRHMVNNAVVVLSSCDSSVGNSRDGIGVRGLTSAFLIGGAGSVVGSLWPVEASSTADLMIRFHRAFSQSKMPVAKALREAQRGFLQAFPARRHPYYWSGFMVTGNLSALR